MEQRESHSWYAGLELYHKQLSTHAQQIMKAIRSEHTRRMQKSGESKCCKWNQEMEELSTDGENMRKGGTVKRFREVEYWNAMEREEANCAAFQPGNVTRKMVDTFHTEAYTENQTERCCTDRVASTFQSGVHSAQSFRATSCHLQVGSGIVNVGHEAPFSLKEFLMTETQQVDLGSQSECTSVQHAIDPAANEHPEALASSHLDMKVGGATACWKPQLGTPAQQSSQVGLPRPTETQALAIKRLNSVQEEKKDNCHKRKKATLKWEKLGMMSMVKQPVLDGGLMKDQGQGTKGFDSRLESRPQICDLITLDSERRPQVLEEVACATFIILTMVYQDGSTQLTAEKEPLSVVSGFLILLLNQSDGLLPGATAETPASANKTDTGHGYFHLKLEQNHAWLQQGQGYREFTRVLLLQILSRKGCTVAFKAKDLLRTVLLHYADCVCWKEANSWEILDPRIAGWLLEPADTSSCFKALVLKHCGTSSASELTSSTTHSTGNTKENCVGLHILHRLMMHLRAKLQARAFY
ncbi:DNA polymerase nu-like [Leucoraja erinacea]|uniref:DNA polymerase nu-like n=1 Tax=Leucoraja erinaceus TaxID=7782 RepID=UPI0024542341|nr:DNA polymerase nu-like [Leucoraja erinacea]